MAMIRARLRRQRVATEPVRLFAAALRVGVVLTRIHQRIQRQFLPALRLVVPLVLPADLTRIVVPVLLTALRMAFLVGIARCLIAPVDVREILSVTI